MKFEKLLLQIGHFSKIVKLTNHGKVVTTRAPKTGTYSSAVGDCVCNQSKASNKGVIKWNFLKFLKSYKWV